MTYEVLTALVGSVFIVSTFIFMYAFYRQKILFNKVIILNMAAAVEKDIFIKKIEQLSKENDELKLSDNNEFIKFLSDSREWAFGYIEEVQVVMEELKEAVLSSNSEKRSEAIAKLILLLPEDPEKLNQN